MTTEALMKPRYKVISNYPGSIYNIGDIIEQIDGYFDLYKDGSTLYLEIELKKYPNIFKPLAWWEERKVSDMPMFIFDKENSQIIYKVKQWHSDGCTFYIGNKFDSDVFYPSPSINEYFLPSTESDYLTYKQSNQ